MTDSSIALGGFDPPSDCLRGGWNPRCHYLCGGWNPPYHLIIAESAPALKILD